MEIIELSLREAEKIAKNNQNNKNFVILDVRTPDETHSCKFENSINIDIFSKDFAGELNKLDKNKIYLVHCRSGSRSLDALKIMKKLNFKKVYHSSEGINCP